MRLTLLTMAGGRASARIRRICQTNSTGAKPDFPADQSNIRMAANNTGNAVGGTGVEQSSESQGVTDKQGKSDMMPNQKAGNMHGANSSAQGAWSR